MSEYIEESLARQVEEACEAYDGQQWKGSLRKLTDLQLLREYRKATRRVLFAEGWLKQTRALGRPVQNAQACLDDASLQQVALQEERLRRKDLLFSQLQKDAEAERVSRDAATATVQQLEKGHQSVELVNWINSLDSRDMCDMLNLQTLVRAAKLLQQGQETADRLYQAVVALEQEGDPQ